MIAETASSTRAKKVRKAYYRIGRRTYGKNETIVGVAFLLPAVVLGLIFTIAPMVASLAYAFTDANLLQLNKATFNGFSNFVRIFTDSQVWNALGNTAIFVVITVPAQMAVSLGLALLLNLKFLRCGTYFRWAFFCPVMLSLAVTSMLWMNLLDYNDGLINTIVVAFGGTRQKFLNDPNQALYLIVLISVWQGAGYQMLIFLSGLKNIPREIYEAASLDGADARQRFLYITLPSIKATFSFVLVTMLIGAFRLITQPMIMTGGGPLESTMTMSYLIYKQGITYRDVGYSSAIALFYTLIMSAVALTVRKLTGGDNTKGG